MAGQLGAEDRDEGQGTGEGDGQRTVQSAGIESYVLDSWTRPNQRFLSEIISVESHNRAEGGKCTKFACNDEGARVEGVKDGHVVVLPLEETHQLFVTQQLVALIGQMLHEFQKALEVVPGVKERNGQKEMLRKYVLKTQRLLKI